MGGKGKDKNSNYGTRSKLTSGRVEGVIQTPMGVMQVWRCVGPELYLAHGTHRIAHTPAWRRAVAQATMGTRQIERLFQVKGETH